jgi:UDP-glucose 4-epimerase
MNRKLKALITGGGGFIGGHLASRLVEDGWQLCIVDNFSRGRRDSFIEMLLGRSADILLVEGDLANPKIFENLGTDFTHVFHMAAMLGVQNVIDEPYKTLTLNCDLLSNVISFSKTQKKLERFVFCSTSEVYARSLGTIGLHIPTPEGQQIVWPDSTQPRSAYAISKLHGEALIAYSGLPYSIIRPHNVYGPRMGMSHVIPELAQKVFVAPTGSEVEVFSVDHTRTFCFIDDAVEMLRRVAVSPASNCAIVNLGSEAPEVTIGSLAALIIKESGKDLRIKRGSTTQGSPLRRCPDMSLMEQITNYRARISLEDGVCRTLKWYHEAFQNNSIGTTK